MTVWNIFRRSFGESLRRYPLVLIMWMGNLIFALSAMMPLYAFVKNQFGHSLTVDSMLEKFNMYWVSDLAFMLRDVQPLLWWPMISALLLFLVLQIFFNAAVLGSLNAWLEKDSLSSFFENGGRLFGRFFKLFLIFLPLYLIALLVLPALVDSVSSGYVERAVNEWPGQIVFLIKTGVMILAFTIVNMVADYAKIAAAQNDRIGALRALLTGGRFLFRTFFRAWALYWLLVIFFLIVSVAYMETENLITANSAALIVVVFLLQQIYMLCRYWIKVQFYQAQMEFFQANHLI